MRKLFLISALFLGLICGAQEYHFTVYNFTVESQDVATVYKLFDDYFSKNKPADVTVSLWENHFNDSGNNFSHSIVFSGSLDAMGAMYSRENNYTWNLFLARLNQHLDEGFSSAMGRNMVTIGNGSEGHPYQRYYLLDVDEMSKWMDSFKKMAENHSPEGQLLMMGNLTVGHGPDGTNAWVISGFKDFKTAMAGAGSLRTEAENEAWSEAWDKHREEGGEVELVRSGLRIQLKSW